MNECHSAKPEAALWNPIQRWQVDGEAARKPSWTTGIDSCRCEDNVKLVVSLSGILHLDSWAGPNNSYWIYWCLLFGRAPGAAWEVGIFQGVLFPGAFLTPSFDAPNGPAGDLGWKLGVGLLISFLPPWIWKRDGGETVKMEISLVWSWRGSPCGLCLPRNYQCS